MSTLTIPPFGRLLREEMTAEPIGNWTPREQRLIVSNLELVLEHTVGVRQHLEERLAQGAEARSLARELAPLLAETKEQLDHIQALLNVLLPSEHATARQMVGILRQLQRVAQVIHDLLAGALARVSAPDTIDWERIRAAEQAYEQGKTRPFSRQ